MVQVPLANGRGVALVDDEDAPAVLAYRWYLHSGRYAARRDGAHILLMHRQILGLEYGDRRQADHIDNCRKLDNRRDNLRVVTPAENCQNLTPRRGYTSRYRGVSRCKQTGRWRAVCGLNGQYFHLGRFDSEEIAASAAEEFRRQRMPFATG